MTSFSSTESLRISPGRFAVGRPQVALPLKRFPPIWTGGQTITWAWAVLLVQVVSCSMVLFRSYSLHAI